ncbi:YcxB family protein [Chitinophaga agrisoli]|uniref:YcxB family protein n=1 Tax=Chitinophaga agrisoli TaxID=2607653 RepID=A0A5B2VQS0_9BACT|nr:YcxB family protein [Chitinophaga agrisoli]KAA2240736.1 YcxB family protein [Chitinophaga agrisoli]
MFPFTISSLLTKKEYTKAYIAAIYRKPLTLVITGACLLVAISDLLQYCGIPLLGTYRPDLTNTLLVAFALVALPLSSWMRASRYYDAQKKIQQVINYQFTDEGLTISGDKFTDQYTWQELHKIRVYIGFVYIYPVQGMGYVIPQKTFTTEQVAAIQQKMKR